MITAQDIEIALGLTGVVLTVDRTGGVSITAAQSVTDGMQTKVQKWWAAGVIASPEEEIWAEKLAGSITDTPTGISLKASRSAKADFADMFTLLTAAIARGLITEATTQSIWDSSNVEHQLPASDILNLILRYGFAWQAMFNEFAP